MCGIAGFVSGKQENGGHDRQARSVVLDRMCRVITHRGPDDQGMMVEPGVALGMRRLAIIDLAGGQQPISNEDGTMSIVFNGEIYNFRELQSGLQTRGHQFQTHCDTESILHLYEEKGAACVDDLRGMFAFAIWDERKRELFIARDRVGKKPLYYTLTKRGTLVFGSELKSLLEHPEVEARTSLLAVDAYLSFGYVPDPLSIFEGIYKLPPASHLTFKDGRIEIKQYWDFAYGDRDGAGARDVGGVRFDEEACLAELRRLLDEAVRVRLISEVPLGAFLSGGVDSSTVVGLMSRHAQRVGAPRVKTFSIGFNEDTYDELKFARVAAKHFDTDHHEFIVTPDACDIAETITKHFDEPFSDPSSIPTYIVSKLAREHVTVTLSGDGGDELFGGYTRYVTERNRSGFSRLPGAMRRSVLHTFSRRLPHGARGRNYLYNIALDGVDRYADNVSLFSQLSRDALYTSDFRAQLRDNPTNITTLFRELATRVGTGEPLDELLYIDSKTYLPGDILTKVDRMSMAVSLETRAPLLDHKLIEFVGKIPAEMKLRGTETKHILKRAVADFVPPEILHRAKQGFGIPLDQWINRQLRDQIHETLTAPRAAQRGYLNQRHVATLLNEHEREHRDHSTQLWALFMLELWHREYVDKSTSSARAQPGMTDTVTIGA